MAKILVIICPIPNLEVQRLYPRSLALSINVQGKALFQNKVVMMHSQSLHLYIDAIIQVILILMNLVKI